ncbi:hypothetical protein U1Q18_017569 [Sarracenia purpurea var. burkii]
MDSRKRPLFDLNELPTGEDEETNGVSCFQHQQAIPSSNVHTSDLFATSNDLQRTMRRVDFSSKVASLSKMANNEDKSAALQRDFGSAVIQAVEKEEGEWSDAEEDSTDAYGSSSMRRQSLTDHGKELMVKGMPSMMDHFNYGANTENIAQINIKNENNDHTIGLNVDNNDQKNNSSQNTEGNCKADMFMDGQEEPGLVPKQREVKGVEASHALKCANNHGKRPRFDQHKEAMLGKKRNRQTMFLNLEDVKQAGPIKTSTPRRQNFPAPTTIRTVKEVRTFPPGECIGEKQSQTMTKDSKQVDLSCNEGNAYVESNDSISECNGDMNSGILGRPRTLNSATDVAADVPSQSLQRQGSSKHPTDSRQLKHTQVCNRRPALTSQSSIDAKLGTKKLPSKKQTTVSTQYQDTSVERLLREVTNEKFWHPPEEAELQCVPGQFDSVEEYVRVFEPLLFEECRAQLYSTWEELTETLSRDLHVMVRVKSIERRERGWYDVVVLPANVCRWTFKEGDVAILSTPRPGIGSFERSSSSTIDDNESEVSGRVAGTVRRYMPIDTRDPPGAILHFYVGDSYDPNRLHEVFSVL